MHVKMDDLVAFSVCSGIGGFDLALESLSVPVCGTSEINIDAQTIGLLTTGRSSFGDVSTLTADRLPYFNVLCAGFPCQAFSINGKMLGFADTRAQVFFEIVRLIKEAQPYCVVFENVPNIVGHDKGKTLATIKSALNDAGYDDIQYRILNAAHFGLPTARKRWFACSFRSDLGVGEVKFPDEIRLPARPLKTVLIPDIDTDRVTVVDASRFIRINRITERDPYESLKIGYIDRDVRHHRVYSISAPAPTFIGSQGGPGAGCGVYEIGNTLRTLHAREMLAAMGFPTNYPMPFDKAAAGRLIGNALCPPVALEVFKSVFAALTEESVPRAQIMKTWKGVGKMAA